MQLNKTLKEKELKSTLVSMGVVFLWKDIHIYII